MQLVTNSRLRAFARCRRLHHFRYELLRRPLVSAKPLAVGSLVHLALEAWWTWFLPIEAGGKRFQLPYEAAVDAIATRVGEARPEDGEVSPFDLAAAEAMMIGYDARWFEDAVDGWTVLAVEPPFAHPIVNPDTGRTSQLYRYGGKIDVVVRRRVDGAEGFIEHKTSGSSLAPESSYWRKLRMDTQISDYYRGARSLGFDPVFCIYDVLGKPGLEPKKATPVEKRKYRKEDGQLYANQREKDETVEEYRDRILTDIETDPNGYYARVEVSRLEEDERERAWDVWQTVKSLHETRVAGRHARNADACFDFGRPCDYFDVCSRVARIDDDFIYRTAHDPHEELSPDRDPVEAAAALAKERDQ